MNSCWCEGGVEGQSCRSSPKLMLMLGLCSTIFLMVSFCPKYAPAKYENTPEKKKMNPPSAPMMKLMAKPRAKPMKIAKTSK
ncbi:MAG: hypothetical protein ABIF88_01745 [archaeon]